MSITKTREFFSLPNVHYAEINKRRSLQTLKKEFSSSLLSLINQYIRSPMQQILWLKKIVILLHTIGAYPPHNMCGAFAHNVLSIKM